jgi:hypothetical protein
MAQKSRLDEVGKYEYLCPDGVTVLKLRGMSDRERRSFLSGRLMILQVQEAQFRNYLVGLTDLTTGHTPTFAELSEKYKPYFDDVRPLVELVGLGDALAVYDTWADVGFYTYTMGLAGRIMLAEQALLTGQEVPAQWEWPSEEQVQAMNQAEAEALGEDSPPRALATATSRSAAPAAKSSAGRKTTTATKRAT